MYYLFKEHPVSIKQTIDKSICVVCTYGKNKRINDISSLLNNTSSNEDTIHETQFMLKLLKAEQKNNVTICIPASIVVYRKDIKSAKLLILDINFGFIE